MKETKKSVTAVKAAVVEPAKETVKNIEAKAEAPAAEKKETVKKAPAKKAVKAPAAKTAAEKKTAVKKETVKKEAVKKETVKKEPAKKAPAKKAASKASQVNVNIQFAGKSYTVEDLEKIAKDVWQYDLNRKISDFKSVELYVKPEESVVYYVINGEVTGSFAI